MIKLFCAPHARSLTSHITLEEARALHGGARPLRTSHPRWPPRKGGFGNLLDELQGRRSQQPLVSSQGGNKIPAAKASVNVSQPSIRL